MGSTRLDLSQCNALVASLVSGDAAAWRPLVGMLGPAVLGYAAASSSLGHRRTDEDAPREVLTAVLERIRKNEFRALRTYIAWREAPDNAQKTLEDWLRIVTDRVACDYVRHKVPRSAIHTLAAVLDTGTPAQIQSPGMTNAQMIRELIEHADRCLPPAQASTVRMVFDGKTPEEIARITGETKERVQKTLRAAYATLRRWVGDRDEES